MRMRRLRTQLGAIVLLGICLGGFYARYDLTQHVTPQFGFACAVVAIVWAIGRLPLAAVVWFVVGTVFLWPVLPQYLPRRAAVPPGCRLVVVTFNERSDRRDDTAAAQNIVALKPDILFVQKAFTPDALRTALISAGWHHFDSLPSPGNKELIASRFPIVRSHDDRQGIWADIVIAGETVRLYGFSAPRGIDEGADDPGNPTFHDDYFTTLTADIAANTGPLILAGDGNASVFSPEMKALRAEVGDAWNEAGYGLGATFPGPWRRIGWLGPFVRIDYILHNRAFAAVSARRVKDATGAGHYPVVAQLVFREHGDDGAACR